LGWEAKLVANVFLKRSAVSGNKAEFEHFGRCEFTGSEALNSELAVSELSGRRSSPPIVK
jgi:hypothetical protein